MPISPDMSKNCYVYECTKRRSNKQISDKRY